MRGIMGATLVITLAGCDAGADAKQELDMVRRNGGSKTEVCSAARKVADAYLRAHDETAYKDAKLTADIECMAAEVDR
jgi:hypothetical protein